MNYGVYCTKWRLEVQNSKLQPPWQLISNAGIKNNTRAMVEEGNGESRKLSSVTRVLKIIPVLWWGEATISPLSWRRIASQNTTNSDCRLCNSVAIYHCVATLLMPNT